MSHLAIHPNQTIAFLGASITEAGWSNPTGYMHLIVDCLAANGIPVTPIPAGIGGNTSRDMLARLERDVIARKPDWMAIDAGRNDVWHGTIGFDEYMRNMTAIVERAQAAGIGVILQTITPIGEDVRDPFNQKLAYSNHFLRYLAAQKGCPIVDPNAAFLDVLKTKTGPEHLLTTDGVHMNPRGDRLMAASWLRGIGLTDGQIAKTLSRV